MNYHVVTPAYGAVYTTQAQVKAAWNNNQDFRMATTGQYMNKQDANKYLPGDKFQIRYGKNLEKVMVI